jgi:hypothetical protein
VDSVGREWWSPELYLEGEAVVEGEMGLSSVGLAGGFRIGIEVGCQMILMVSQINSKAMG